MMHRVMQEKYGFKAAEFHAQGFADKEEYKKKHGSDLFLVDIDKYDSICKVRLPPIPLQHYMSSILCPSPTFHITAPRLTKGVFEASTLLQGSHAQVGYRRLWCAG